MSVVLSHRNNNYGLFDCWVFVFKKELHLFPGLLLVFSGVPFVQGIMWMGAGKIIRHDKDSQILNSKTWS